MKSNGFTSILLGILAVSALASLILCGFYIHYARQSRAIQGTIGAINLRQAGVQQLIGDVVEYSKKTKDNKEIVQILESVGLRAITNIPSGAQGAGAANPK